MLPPDLVAIVFDAGGTLVHIDYDHIARLAAARGARLSRDALRRGDAAARQAVDAASRAASASPETDEARRAPYFETLLRAAGVAEEGVGALLADLEREHAAENLWRVPMPGVVETLGGLRARGLRTAVVSNADGRIESGLARVGLSVHLDLIVDSHVEGVEKPDPEIFHRALGRLGVPAARAAYVGDIYSIDAVGARAAGLVPVLIDPTRSYPPVDCPVIADLRELLAWLEGPPPPGPVSSPSAAGRGGP